MMVSVGFWLDASLSIMSQHIEFIWTHSISRLLKKYDIVIKTWFWVTFLWVSLLRYLSAEDECFFQPFYLLLPDSSFDSELLEQVKELEMGGVSAAEAGDLQTALQLFSQAVQILPERASAYNNRAQALRLLGDTAGKPNSFCNNPFRRHWAVLCLLGWRVWDQHASMLELCLIQVVNIVTS